MPYLIAGLGNPDKKYEHTRHNAGFDALDYLAEKYGIRIRESSSRTKATVRSSERKLTMTIPIMKRIPSATMNISTTPARRP